MAVRVTGLRPMLDTLERLADPARVEGEAREALREAGMIVQARMSEEAPERTAGIPGPKGLPLAPGELKRGIGLSVGRAEQGRIVATIAPNHKVWRVANWIEYGHRLVRGGYSKQTKTGQLRGKGKVVGFVQPRPFMRRAWEATKREAAETVRKELSRRIRAIKNG